MKKVTFNVVLNEPEQLVHLDLFDPVLGFLVFGNFTGIMMNIDKFKITGVSFYVRQADTTICLSPDEEPAYLYPEILNVKYLDENHVDNPNDIKQIKFGFRRTTSTTKPSQEIYEIPSFIVRRGEQLDLDLTPIDFDSRRSCDEKNINGHICNIKFFF